MCIEISAYLDLRSIFDRPYKGTEWRVKFKCLLRTYKWTELRSNFKRIVLSRVVDPYETLFSGSPCLVFKTILYFTETLLFLRIPPTVVELDGLHFVRV